MADQNYTTYTAADIVSYYTQLHRLQPAEEAILKRFQGQWAKMKMLDIGVGGGRTTQHFAPIVAEYVGIDYSANMIAACQQRFSAPSSSIRFAVCDARDMSQFADDTFDFILFSFNGIDYMSHCDRLKVFQEVQRVGKPGGYFFFSSHNLQGIEREFDIKAHLSFNPLKTYVNLIMFAILRLMNRSTSLTRLRALDHAILQDESHNFRLKTYYIRPAAQLKQLFNAGFHDVQIFSWQTGNEMASQDDLKSNAEMWLYYLCSKAV